MVSGQEAFLRDIYLPRHNARFAVPLKLFSSIEPYLPDTVQVRIERSCKDFLHWFYRLRLSSDGRIQLILEFAGTVPHAGK